MFYPLVLNAKQVGSQVDAGFHIATGPHREPVGFGTIFQKQRRDVRIRFS